MPRNNAQKHLKRQKMGGGGNTDYESYQHSPMYMEKFFGDNSVNVFSCFAEEDENDSEGIISERVLFCCLGWRTTCSLLLLS